MPISLRNTTSIFPYVRFSPAADKMSKAGEDGKPCEIPFIGKSLAIDIENGLPGWLMVDAGQRDWQAFTINGEKPPSPGPNYKLGFWVLLVAPKLLGSAEAFEMCANTHAHKSFCERLFNEAESNFGKGIVPIVKLTGSESIKIGKGKSRELHFEIVKWIPRPEAFLVALEKIKSAAAPSKDNRAADPGGDDFDDEDVTAAAKAKPAEPKEKKPRGKKDPPKEPPPQGDLLGDDPIPYS